MTVPQARPPNRRDGAAQHLQHEAALTERDEGGLSVAAYAWVLPLVELELYLRIHPGAQRQVGDVQGDH